MVGAIFRGVLVAVAVLLAACGGAEEAAPTDTDTAAAEAEATLAETETAAADDEPTMEATETAGTEPSPAETATGQEPVANACPAEGCQIEITNVAREGDELAVTWEANFLPDLSRNHIHIYWDAFSAEQVSSDAEARGVEQGQWVATDAYPTFVTEGAASVENRGESTALCVTAGNREHAVLDASLADCVDVAHLLEG